MLFLHMTLSHSPYTIKQESCVHKAESIRVSGCFRFLCHEWNTASCSMRSDWFPISLVMCGCEKDMWPDNNRKCWLSREEFLIWQGVNYCFPVHLDTLKMNLKKSKFEKKFTKNVKFCESLYIIQSLLWVYVHNFWCYNLVPIISGLREEDF